MIVALGFFVLPLFVSIPFKYVLIVIVAAVATLGMVELARRWNVTRALLGPPPLNRAKDLYSQSVKELTLNERFR